MSERSGLSTRGALRLPIRLTRRGAASSIALLALLNVLFVTATGLYLHYLRLPDGPEWLKSAFARHLNLGDENVLAAWYSSMLLLLAAVMAAVCFAVDDEGDGSIRERAMRAGWIPVAALLSLLSLSEIGSIHERLGMVEGLGLSGESQAGWVYTLAVPFAAAAVYLLVFAWQRLARYRLACLLFAAGVALYATVPAHEYFEGRVLAGIDEHPRYSRPIAHLLLEEGTELFGTLALFAAMAMYAVNAVERSGAHGGSKAVVVLSMSAPLALAATSAALLLGDLAMRLSEWAAKTLPAHDTGIPHNWFPSALAALAAVGAFQWRHAVRVGATERASAPLFAVGLFGIALSAYYGAHGRGWINALRRSIDDLPMIVGTTLVAIAVVLALLLARHAAGAVARCLALAWPLLLALALSGWQRRGDAGAVDYWACAVFLLAVVAQAANAGARIDAREASRR